MSKLAEFKALEAKLAEQLAQLDALKNDGQLKREIEFEGKFNALLAEYGFSLPEVISILDPQASRDLHRSRPRRSRAKANVALVHSRSTSIRTPTSGSRPRVAITKC